MYAQCKEASPLIGMVAIGLDVGRETHGRRRSASCSSMDDESNSNILSSSRDFVGFLYLSVVEPERMFISRRGGTNSLSLMMRALQDIGSYESRLCQ